MTRIYQTPLKQNQLFFDVGPEHKKELNEYFDRLEQCNIKFNIVIDTTVWNPVMGTDGDCIYSMNLIKKTLDKILVSNQQ